MTQNQIKRLYAIAIQELIDANKHSPFADKSQAMRDINFWRNQLNNKTQVQS
jgi:hypothetical protein